ncbi:MAG: histidine phosphatase family protein [Candidatus Paceibacterota bacterium]|jgi:broad specificity phosphatase PhoE
MITVYVVRHGEAEGNAKKKLMGQSDPSLTAIGKKDAYMLGERLRSVKFDKVYTSDLERAWATTDIIAKILNLSLEPIKTEKLREIDTGDCCGMDLECFFREYPESKNSADFCFPKGESYREFFCRIANFLKSLAKDYDDEIILIVAHEGVIKAIEYYFGYLEFRNHQKTKISHEYVRKFVVDGGNPAE